MESLLSNVELLNNPDPRVACALLLDTSGSMSENGKIDALNSALQKFKTELANDSVAKRRVEVCVITFNDMATQICDFSTVDKFAPPTLVAGGTTAMGAAVLMGLDVILQRTAMYDSNGLSRYKPWLFLLTDGDPTDDITQATDEAQRRAKEVVFFGIGIGAGANQQVLKQLSPTRAILMDGLKFSDLFLWLTQSLIKVGNSRPGEQLKLDSPPGLFI